MIVRRLGWPQICLGVHLGTAVLAGFARAADDVGASEAPSTTSVTRQYPQGGRHDLEVVVQLQSQEGRVFCALWPAPEGFPAERSAASHEDMSDELHDQTARLRFTDVATGEYALACFHDENANGRLDTHLIGIPAEGTGASNGARGFMGPPRFEDARFEITDTGPKRLTVEIEY